MADRGSTTDQPRPRRRLPRVMLGALAFVLIGAVANVASVWIIALTVQLEFEGISQGETLAARHTGNEVVSYVFVNRNRFHDHAAVFDFEPRQDRNPVQRLTFEQMHDSFARDAPAPAPPWAEDAAASSWKATTMPGQRIAMAFGWPLRVLAFQCQESDPMDVRGGLALRFDPTSPAMTPARTLPLIPIWPGAALNTIIICFIVCIPVAAMRAVRRHRRIKRSQCPGCGYPMGTSPVCTECGQPL